MLVYSSNVYVCMYVRAPLIAPRPVFIGVQAQIVPRGSSLDWGRGDSGEFPTYSSTRSIRESPVGPLLRNRESMTGQRSRSTKSLLLFLLLLLLLRFPSPL